MTIVIAVAHGSVSIKAIEATSKSLAESGHDVTWFTFHGTYTRPVYIWNLEALPEQEIEPIVDLLRKGLSEGVIAE